MFRKKIELTALLAFNRFASKNVTEKKITVVSFMIGTVVLLLLLIVFNSIILRTALMSLSLFFLIYWAVSIFIYLYKKSQYGVFNRMVQRFWKRALWLFWVLEVFLFSIYIFLAAISPQEISYMLDNSQLVFDVTLKLGSFFKTLSYALIIILLANIQLLVHKYNSLRAAVTVFICVLLVRAVFEDFIQFYAINNFYRSFNWSHVHLELNGARFDDNAFISKYAGVWELEVAELKARTICHYYYLLVFLKLWHTVFVFMFFIFFEGISWRTRLSSYNVLAANMQNFYFLMFFSYILKIVLLRQYFSYLSGYVFFWFSVNSNSYDISYIYILVDLGYFMFAWNDISSFYY